MLGPKWDRIPVKYRQGNNYQKGVRFFSVSKNGPPSVSVSSPLLKALVPPLSNREPNPKQVRVHFGAMGYWWLRSDGLSVLWA